MYAAFVIWATLATLITAKTLSDGNGRPLRDTNPDCNVTPNETRTHVYKNCTFVCQQDEAFFLSENQSCTLYSGESQNHGICVNGTCVPVPVNKGANATDNGRPSIGHPPVDKDPDCNVAANETHVYLNCTYTCQVDEAFFLSENQSCRLYNYGPMDKGICVNGACVPVLVDGEENATEIVITSETPAPRPPGCDDNTSSNHTHESCVVKCGDELVTLNSSQPCFLPNASSSRGICVEGQCIHHPANDEESATETEIPDETTAAPMPPGCDDNESSNHTHQDCNILCGDEMIALNRSQPCYLKTTTTLPVPVPVSGPIAMERSDVLAEVGVCQEGTCVPRRDYLLPQPVE